MFELRVPQGFDCVFYSQYDEAVFFRWLESIPGVIKVEAVGQELVMTFRRKQISRVTLQELIALHTRYNLPMRALAEFESPRNRPWFRSRQAHWYTKVFAKNARRSNPSLERPRDGAVDEGSGG